ncbi:MAG: hypothetical protein WCW87_03955 [Candidatus Paceibacterota bacterium]
MSQVEFEEEKSRSMFRNKKHSFVTDIFIKLGFKSEAQVAVAMITASIMFIIITMSILFFQVFHKPTFSPPEGTTKFYKEDLTPEDIRKLPPGMFEKLPSKYGNQEKSPY